MIVDTNRISVMSKEITEEIAQAIQVHDFEYVEVLLDMDLTRPQPRMPTKNEIWAQRFIEMKLRDSI